MVPLVFVAGVGAATGSDSATGAIVGIEMGDVEGEKVASRMVMGRREKTKGQQR